MDANLEDKTGRAYGMEEGTSDMVLAEVGPGTPGGELLRRYWTPVALTSDATTLPKQIRRLGEDLILFRTKSGEPSLLYPRCVHRGTSLLYGRVEDDGIRCCYHGWKFGSQGHCLDQPCEPDGGRNKQRYRQPWYPVIEMYGAIWAYMGPPDKQPLPPIYSCFEDLQDNEKIVATYFSSHDEIQPFPVDHNWFQTFENSTDHYHISILHASHSGQQFPDERLNEKIPDSMTWEYSKDGQSIFTTIERKLDNGETWMRIEQCVMPNILSLPPFFNEGMTNFFQCFVAVDDGNFIVIDFSRQDKAGSQIYPSDNEERGYGPTKLKWKNMTLEQHQQYPIDYEAQHSMGTITLHSKEHLANTDRGIGMHRRLYKQMCELVAKGGDPAGVAFKEEDRVVKVEARSWVVPADELAATEDA